MFQEMETPKISYPNKKNGKRKQKIPYISKSKNLNENPKKPIFKQVTFQT